MIKKSINLWVSPEGRDIYDIISIIKDAGFDAVEPNLDETGYLSLESTERDIENFRNHVEKTGLKIASISSGLLWKYTLSSPDSEVRKKAESVLKKQIECAKILGTDGILVIPGVVQADWAGQKEIVSYDIVWERTFQSLKNVIPYAQKNNVCLCLEPVWNKFLVSPIEMKRFVESFSSEYIGVYFDTGNVMPYGYPEMWIRILGKHIKKIHFKDFKTQIGNLNGFCMLLEGDVNWPEVTKALKEIGFEGYATAEYWAYRYYPETVIHHASISMDRILGG
ncbi:MAG TPA: sugar phosphate isomerase/epimerase family protein [Candidatus Ratteibacteria bacterium]|uniref:L-ribulose-5-phosphate 3-epimerase UlaE n=1 Tax=candidate division TA06 bacterium ADurb.Bin131 TaxID=1852827 RepID=A0A1V6CAW6_UNCT6|nr:MAG: L-ribulose-5-phosphate 3-epimerase UlaE [candidate division TA06 bacterium ADurb.Bin131]HON05918.1 sugar phosphate isomerase/epimerase family protein [bacterium]HOQ82052.1 sugar phosphate isomerase/epimerase family protein [bacterium]HRS06382.1 sugar phosphate isomerase/epimerase family protein [Candidatus Ratteibacteria bacterium]HRV04622.1 sugar phosphate isomerase/epimerase family protein [Candidatus Ratteibacteria bacterium]